MTFREQFRNLPRQMQNCNAAKHSWLKDRKSATPAVGAGIYPLESSSGQRNITGSLASSRRRRNRLSTYSWLGFIRRIDLLFSKSSIMQFAQEAVSTVN